MRITNGKIKIVFLIGGFSLGGKERQLAELIKGLPKEEYKITLIVKYADAHYMEYIRDGIKYQELNTKRFGITALIKLIKIFQREKPDIVHCWLSIGSIFMIFLRLFYKYTLIDGSIRDAFHPKGIQLIYRKIINSFARIIIANSNAGMLAYKVPFKKGKVIYNGFDLSRIENIEGQEVIRKRWNITTLYIVGMVARIDKYKDYPTFTKAINLILSKRKDITFLIVGDGDQKQAIIEMLDAGFKDYVIFTGNQSNVESFINIFNIGILVTNFKIHSEGISNSILEYMALGKPVIVSEGGGTSELVINGKTGILIRQSNVNELVEKIIYLIDNHDIAIQMGKEGRKRIEECFSFQKMIDNYNLIYSLHLIKDK
jgi:glycosyltransferase involved in cell wall biosynthesis